MGCRVRLGDIATIRSGGTPSKSNTAYWNGDIPWVSAKSMDSNQLNNSLLYITKDGVENGSKLAHPGDILILTRGSGLFNRIPIIWVEKTLAFNQDIKCLTVKNRDDARYLYCWLLSQRDVLADNLDVTGIGAGKINTNFLSDMHVWWPNVDTRRRLAHVCDSLLEQEALLNRTNGYLAA